MSFFLCFYFWNCLLCFFLTFSPPLGVVEAKKQKLACYGFWSFGMLLDSIGVVLESKLPSEIFESATIGHLVCCMWPSVASCVGCLRRVTCLTYNPHNRDNPPPPPPPTSFWHLQLVCVDLQVRKMKQWRVLSPTLISNLHSMPPGGWIYVS